MNFSTKNLENIRKNRGFERIAKILTIIILLIFGFHFTQAQSPEELEKIKHIQDSMMNLPQMKALLESNPEMKKALMEQMKAKQKGSQSQKRKIAPKSAANKSSSSDSWYWENTIASTNNKFKNWSGGEADITMSYKGPGLNTFIIGTIKADGNIVFNLPKSVTTKTSLTRQLGPQGLFFDIYGNAPVNYSNKEAGFITNPSLPIMRNDKRIGNLTIGNSVRVTKNLTTQSGVDSGDEGYILYWAYANESCGITLDQNWKGEVRKDGTNEKEVETNVNYNLHFKPGWNLIKTEVIGKYKLDHERGLDVSWFKNHRHTIISSILSDAIYYYRAIPQY